MHAKSDWVYLLTLISVDLKKKHSPMGECFLFSVQVWDGTSDGEHFGAAAGETRTIQLFVGSSWVMG